MKTAMLLLLALALPGGERERGLQAYREGRFAEAAAAFRAAIAQDGDSPELQWNLALASWRAGELDAAETAVEKYAAASKDARVDLHAGLLGAVRHDEAKALEAQADAAPPADGAPPDPLPLLEQALAKATQARDHFVRGAAAHTTPELLRNTERALRTIDALQRRIDELKKQREQQQKEADDQKDDEKRKDDEKQDEKKDEPKQQPKPEDEKQDQPKPSPEKPDQQKPDSGKADPKPQPGQQGEGDDQPEPQAPPDSKDGKGEKPPAQPSEQPKPGDGEPQPAPDQPEPKAGEPRSDAPGEGTEGHVLSPEQTQRLLEQLRELDDKHKAIRLRMKAARKPVERDW